MASSTSATPMACMQRGSAHSAGVRAQRLTHSTWRPKSICWSRQGKGSTVTACQGVSRQKSPAPAEHRRAGTEERDRWRPARAPQVRDAGIGRDQQLRALHQVPHLREVELARIGAIALLRVARAHRGFFAPPAAPHDLEPAALELRGERHPALREPELERRARAHVQHRVVARRAIEGARPGCMPVDRARRVAAPRRRRGRPPCRPMRRACRSSGASRPRTSSLRERLRPVVHHDVLRAHRGREPAVAVVARERTRGRRALLRRVRARCSNRAA